MKIRRVLVLGAIAAFFGTASPTMLAQGPQIDKKEQEKRNKQQQEDVTALVQLVDTASATPAAGPEQKSGDVAITWDSNHFIKGQDGSTYVPFTVKVDRGSLSSEKAALYIRAVAKGAAAPAPAPAPAANDKDKKAAAAAPRPMFPWDNAYFITVKQDGIVQRAMALPGGEYDVYIAVRDQGTGDKKQVAKSGVLRRTMVIPDYKKPELATSSIMVGSVEPLAAPLSREQQQENPYVFGAMKINPMKEAKLPKSGQLSLIFWIYGAEVNPTTKKPDVTIEYNFHQKTGDRKQVAKSGVLRRTMVVPDYKKPELATSSIMIGTVEPLAAPLSREQQQENPYTFGSMKIIPMKEAKLAKSGQLSLLFWIYGAEVNPTTRKPDVTIEYNFHQKTGDTEKYFNKTAPQELNATTLPPEFDLAAGHQLPGSLEVPLASFPEGDYRLEITIKDKATGKELKQNVNFTVSPA